VHLDKCTKEASLVRDPGLPRPASAGACQRCRCGLGRPAGRGAHAQLAHRGPAGGGGISEARRTRRYVEAAAPLRHARVLVPAQGRAAVQHHARALQVSGRPCRVPDGAHVCTRPFMPMAKHARPSLPYRVTREAPAVRCWELRDSMRAGRGARLVRHAELVRVDAHAAHARHRKVERRHRPAQLPCKGQNKASEACVYVTPDARAARHLRRGAASRRAAAAAARVFGNTGRRRAAASRRAAVAAMRVL